MKPETDDERILEMDDEDRERVYWWLEEGNSKHDLITMLLERMSDDEIEQILKDSCDTGEEGAYNAEA